MNLTETFRARKDAYAKRQGDLIVTTQAVLLGDCAEVWGYFRALGGLEIRVIVECKDGTRRDIIGRQGVHKSAQDGEVQGIGSPMACAKRLRLSFWTCVFGKRKVNTGAGKGFRTLRAAGILAFKVQGTIFLTAQGMRAMATYEPVSI